jgi:hypothetical protein
MLDLVADPNGELGATVVAGVEQATSADSLL